MIRVSEKLVLEKPNSNNQIELLLKTNGIPKTFDSPSLKAARLTDGLFFCDNLKNEL